MKLKVSYLFFILLGILLLSHLGFSIKENFEQGDKSEYILKSAIVPPVCPKCPDVKLCPKCGGDAVQPCPPCGRCPKPAFKCAKVPDYNASNVDSSLPRPILSRFASF